MRRPGSLIIAVLVLAAACSSTAPTTKATSNTSPVLASSTTRAPFAVRQSINQLDVTGATPGITLALYDATNHEIQRGSADDLGSLIFRNVPEGPGYHVQQKNVSPAPTSPSLRVMSVSNSLPPQTFYNDQHLVQGYQYITTRDGTTLSADVFLPGPADKGPYPTVVEYSGYSPSNPTDSIASEAGTGLPTSLTNGSECAQLTILCDTPDQPSSLLAAAMGYAVVAVNMRGTGCSGGAYDFFEPLQLTDGYDVIETVAAQPWVLGGKVGMVGLSYPAISELFVASTQPPHLAAIAPLSVIDDTGRGVLAPGGIFNSGFALSWARNVLDDARPYGQSWTKTMVDQHHDLECASNQDLRLQNVDTVAKAKAQKYYNGAIADPLSPDTFADKITVPVFLACAWQDEQTGGRCARLSEKFTNAPVVKETYYNGAHADGFQPDVLVQWKTFLDIYVAGKITPIPPIVRQFAPLIMQQIYGVSVPLPPDQWQGYSSFAAAKAAYEAQPSVRILFESGRGNPPGAPGGGFQAYYTSFPPPDVKPLSYYLQPDGSLASAKPPAAGGGSQFAFDPALGDKVTLPGSDENEAFDALPPYQWANDKPGDAAVFLTAPLTKDETFVGTGNADLWVASSATDADLEVTLSEVRPDGKETYVQAGFLRVSERALDDDATLLDPNPGLYQSQVQPLTPGKYVQAQIEIFPFGHVFRAGSRIRISVHTPGGDRPRWSWILGDHPAGTTISIAHDAAHPSRIILPLTANVPGTPPTLPACPSLRGQPCRTFVPYTNTPTS